MIEYSELEHKMRILCARLGVSDAFEYVRDHNPSKNVPYHNWYHTLCMVQNCVEGGNYHDLPYRSLQNLAVAALFHDFAHSAGKSNDTTNIANALMGLERFCFPQRNDTLAVSMVSEVTQIISVTEYPYVLDPICIEQRIIRDADLMQSFAPFWKEMIIDGLRQEMIIKLGRNITEVEMCYGQRDFLQGAVPLSKWGKHIMWGDDQLDLAMDNFERLAIKLEFNNDVEDKHE